MELESPFEAQIHLDLSRSLPKHVLFTESGGAGLVILKNENINRCIKLIDIFKGKKPYIMYLKLIPSMTPM